MPEYGQHLCRRVDQYQEGEMEMVLRGVEHRCGTSRRPGDRRRGELVFGRAWTILYRDVLDDIESVIATERRVASYCAHE